MKQLLSFLAGCLLATSTLAAGLTTPRAVALNCQQPQPRAEQSLPGKNTLTRDEQAKLAAHLDMLAEQAAQPGAAKADGDRPDKPGRYTASQSRQADEMS